MILGANKSQVRRQNETRVKEPPSPEALAAETWSSLVSQKEAREVGQEDGDFRGAGRTM